MTMNELRLAIAEILDEAKKKKVKADDLKKKGRSTEAYGLYDEAFDFSAPLGAYNLYRNQGAVNWGPQTSAGSQVDTSFANPNVGPTRMSESEQAIRMVVRDVIKNGLIPEQSAWAPMLEKQQTAGTWGKAAQLFEAWYDNAKKSKQDEPSTPRGGKGNWDKTEYDQVKKHGFEKKPNRK